MSNAAVLDKLLAESGLAENAQRVEANLVRLQWGSAFVLVGVSGSAIVAIAPLFRAAPKGQELAFFKKLLAHNAYMGGMASFALQPDGWVVLQAGRAIKGLDATEFATMVCASAARRRLRRQADRRVLRVEPEATNRAPIDHEPDKTVAAE